MGKSADIQKLLTVKSLRRKLAELEAAKARNAVLNAEDAVNRAVYSEEATKQGSETLRKKRISELLEKPDNVAVQNALIGNVFAKTDYEIAQAIERTGRKRQELDTSQHYAAEKQKNLARFLQMEERAKQFFERVKSAEDLEALRSE